MQASALGLTPSLRQLHAAPFLVTVACAQPDPALSVSALKAAGPLLDRTVARCVLTADRNPARVKGAPALLVYR